jgi:LmbE family N-acetylglucosaminyl deacetylase
MIRVAVLGAAGRMGRETCRAVAGATDMNLVAGVDPRHAGADVGIAVASGLDNVVEARAEVAVDFTRASAALANARWCLEHGIHVVVGTTGVSPEELQELGRIAERADANALVAPNFAVGAVLMMRFAEQAAKHLDAAERDGDRDGATDRRRTTRHVGSARWRRCAPGRSRRRRRGSPRPRRPSAGAGGASRGDLRRSRTDAHDPARLHRSHLVHARRAAGDPVGCLATGSHGRSRDPARGMTRSLAVVVAHPDDDTFGCAGTVALHRDDPDFRFLLVHATAGEAGQIAEGSGATRERLGEIRQEEDRRSWVVLGREPDRHEWLGYPDGGVGGVPFDDIVDRIAAIFREDRPDVVITFGPDGVTGHVDHVTVGKAATEAFHRCRAEGLDGFDRLLHQSIKQSDLDAWNERLVAEGKEPMDPSEMFRPRGVPDDTIGVEVDCSSVVERKLAALLEHRTQAGELQDWSEEQERAALAWEHHVVAWPPRTPDGPVLRDVFDGLD